MKDYDLDSFVRSKKGVNGFLESQQALNRLQYEEFSRVLSPAGQDFELLFANVLEAAKFATATEAKLREEARLHAAGKSGERSHSDTAMLYNRQAVRAADRAIRIAKKAAEKMADAEGRLMDLRDFHKSQESHGLLQEAREAFVHGLAEFDFLKIEEFKELVSIWDDTAAIAAKSGARGILEHIEKNMVKFNELREREDRGTGAHSPLPWWKYVVIAAYIGGSAFAVFACFFWGACTWVWGLISATSPWLKNMIDWGC